jgi:hypothetical protein
MSDNSKLPFESFTCPTCDTDPLAVEIDTGPDPFDLDAFPLVAADRLEWSTKATPVERRQSPRVKLVSPDVPSPLRSFASASEAAHDRAERLADELAEARARIRELETERERTRDSLAVLGRRHDETERERDLALKNLAHACSARNDAVRMAERLRGVLEGIVEVVNHTDLDVELTRREHQVLTIADAALNPEPGQGGASRGE